jgi:DNA-binding transcriptional regulator YiaG
LGEGLRLWFITRPTGPALVLLNVIRRKGIEAIL